MLASVRQGDTSSGGSTPVQKAISQIYVLDMTIQINKKKVAFTTIHDVQPWRTLFCFTKESIPWLIFFSKLIAKITS